MIVKKFQAPTETEAVLKARDELGSSAVVLNVKTLKQRGIFRLFRKDMVEITAAQEENEGAGEKSRTSFDEIAGDMSKKKLPVFRPLNRLSIFRQSGLRKVRENVRNP